MTTVMEVSFTQALTAFLSAGARGAEGHEVHVHARSPHGIGYQHLRLRIPAKLWTHLPQFAFSLLEAGWEARVGAAARHAGSEDFASLSILFAVFQLPLDFKSASGETARWHRDEVAAADALRRLGQFALAPGFIVDGFNEIAGIWPLVDPIRDLEHARRLQRRLADVLGGATKRVSLPVPSSTTAGGRLLEAPADDPLAFLPLAGAIVRQAGQPAPIVTFAAAAPEICYTVRQIEAAIGQEGKIQ